MQWLNEPASWQRTGDVLRVSVDPGTDFWRTTGYGYVHDNGHVYGDLLPGDLDVSVRVRGSFASQYDQAGIMLRADERTWLKTGVEFFEGRPRLSTVLTVGWSSWMVADLPPGTDEVTLRASRRGDAVEVRYAAGDGAAELAALVFLPPDLEMLAGIVCAAPEGTGFSVTFHDLRIVGREWGGQAAGDAAGWAGEAATPGAGWGEQAPGGGWDDAGGDWEGARLTDWEESDEDPAGWEGGRPGETAGNWAADGPGEAAGGWAAGQPDEVEPGWAGDAPGGERPAGITVDWARPQASEAAEDWDRLSMSAAAGRNAGPAGRPAPEGPEGPAAGQAGQDSAPADNATDPVLATVGPQPATAVEPDAEEPDAKPADPGGTKAQRKDPDRADAGGTKAQRKDPDRADAGGTKAQRKDPDRADAGGTDPGQADAGGKDPGGADPDGRNARGRKKARLPRPRPDPAAAAEEWISLLTADPADE